MNVDDKLLAWVDVEAMHHWDDLLIGNGASIAVWDRFGYNSLYGIAPLSTDDRAIFDALGTTDFEQVLRSLQISSLVCQQLGHPAHASGRYQSVRRALVDAVHQVHVPWELVADAVFHRIATALRRFKHVFSTNYDLIVYWAIAKYGLVGFKDFFWSDINHFDPDNVEAWGSDTLLYYLHGALHLVERSDGVALKQVNFFRNLLDAFADPRNIPLFVSEGSSEQKLRAIRASDYLRHCYETLEGQLGNLVVFGSALGPQDAHIAKAILSNSDRAVAVSVYPGKPEGVILTKMHVAQVLSGVREVLFFDSTTHPLGDPSNQVILRP